MDHRSDCIVAVEPPPMDNSFFVALSKYVCFERRPHDPLPQLPFEILCLIYEFVEPHVAWKHGVVPHFTYFWPSPLARAPSTVRDVARVLGPADDPSCAPDRATPAGVLFAIRFSGDAPLAKTVAPRVAQNDAARCVAARAARLYGVDSDMYAAVLAAAARVSDDLELMYTIAHVLEDVPAEEKKNFHKTSRRLGTAMLIDYFGRHMAAQARGQASGVVAVRTAVAQGSHTPYLRPQQFADRIVSAHARLGTTHRLARCAMRPGVDASMSLSPNVRNVVARFGDDCADKFDLFTALCTRHHFGQARTFLPQLGLRDLAADALRAAPGDGVIDDTTPEGNAFINYIPWRAMLNACDTATALALFADVNSTGLDTAGFIGVVAEWLADCVGDNAYCATLALLVTYNDEFATAENVLANILTDLLNDTGGPVVGIEVMTCIHAYAAVYGGGDVAGLVGEAAWASLRDSLRAQASASVANPFWALTFPLCLHGHVGPYLETLDIFTVGR